MSTGPLFKSVPFIGFRLLLFTGLSILLMVIDHRGDKLEKVRTTLSLAVAPIQYLVDKPLALFDWAEANFTSQQKLLQENAYLHAEHLLLRSQIQKLTALKKENKQLRALLQSAPHVGERVMITQLLAVDTNPFVHEITLDKGSREGVYVGQPVLDANGVMGQVIRVNPISSQVLLLTDSRSAIPIQVNRNGIRAIAVGGDASGTLALVNTAKTVDIKAGDLLVTSGLGQRFPAGYPVGIVKNITRNPGDSFARIKVEPSAHLNRGRLALLVWPPVMDKQHETKKSQT